MTGDWQWLQDSTDSLADDGGSDTRLTTAGTTFTFRTLKEKDSQRLTPPLRSSCPNETWRRLPEHGDEPQMSLIPEQDVSDEREAVLLLSHRAGGGIEAADLVALARMFPQQGPWRRAGKRVATPPSTLDEAFFGAAAVVRAEHQCVPLVVAGRSAGTRSTARTAEALVVSRCLPLAFLLHLPGKPRSHGSTRLPGADHSFKVLKTGPLDQEEALVVVAKVALEWVLYKAAGGRPGNQHW
ncbi:hypothetical protein QBC39DRAFT_335459 [Podospora conica]|nr:hypothetical protein QBC39DRAFT_335459 [Schizothecium conicum]